MRKINLIHSIIGKFVFPRTRKVASNANHEGVWGLAEVVREDVQTHKKALFLPYGLSQTLLSKTKGIQLLEEKDNQLTATAESPQQYRHRV